MFVFRNNTIERFFPKDYQFSGYDDISYIPQDATGYVWFYQVPIKYDSGLVAEEIQRFAQSFQYVLDRIDSSKLCVALTMELLYDVVLTEDDHRIRQAVNEYNQFLFQAAEKNVNVKVIDLSDFTRNYPASQLIDWKYYFISQMGLNPHLSKAFSQWWHRKMDTLALKRKKCLVLDLDNTLWGGVIGEDGITGIKIGGDYPGKAFLYFQQSLLQLTHSGIILAVCSKNNEADVREVWDKNPFNLLKENHFSAKRINWNDKASNIRSIAMELNIGLDSIVFIDDNPSERELIRQSLPMVAVPDFPEQPYDLPVFISQVVDAYFKVYTITDEDRQKTQQYQRNHQRALLETSCSDMEKFKRSLEIKLTIEEANEFSIPRIAQMTQKTNQFNLTTQRYTESDVRQRIADGWKVWTLRVADRFGDEGITGCVFVHDNLIDSFLLSCRILGKDIEYAFLKVVLSELKVQGLREVKANYYPTMKNGQVRDFYEKCGFTCINQTERGKAYHIHLDSFLLNIGDCYQIEIK